MQTEIYYNTTNLAGVELMQEHQNSKTQDGRIILFFQSNQSKLFTPFDVLDRVFNNAIPITSVRRSITNLEKKGSLLKCFEQRVGIYGKKNYCWTFNK